MIEKILLDYLNDALSVSELAEAPEPKRDEPKRDYVLIERIGGDENDGIKHAAIAIQSCSTVSLFRAIQINTEVISAMERMPEQTQVYSAHLTNNYNFTNTKTKTYRYQAVFDIFY